MKAAVELPPGADENEWLHVNVVDLFNDLNTLNGLVSASE